MKTTAQLPRCFITILKVGLGMIFVLPFAFYYSASDERGSSPGVPSIKALSDQEMRDVYGTTVFDVLAGNWSNLLGSVDIEQEYINRSFAPGGGDKDSENFDFPVFGFDFISPTAGLINWNSRMKGITIDPSIGGMYLRIVDEERNLDVTIPMPNNIEKIEGNLYLGNDKNTPLGYLIMSDFRQSGTITITINH